MSVQGVYADSTGLEGTEARVLITDTGDWNRKQIQQISALVSHGNLSHCQVRAPASMSGGPTVHQLPAVPYNGTAGDMQAAFDALGPDVLGAVKVALEDYRSPTKGSVWTVVLPDLAMSIPVMDCGSQAQVGS